MMMADGGITLTQTTRFADKIALRVYGEGMKAAPCRHQDFGDLCVRFRPVAVPRFAAHQRSDSHGT